ncbi:hypothetical protein ANCDUO_14051 [Ancylostoma duodenale]|uniref:Uncharacterized protein n=1 Tax=Ancylostoma duodenale TaxID=51022 RepID=A0A0C2GF74_9BILA|nr:hypothetical protein ANCDUO_14051 [Ancylostoma duodenale]
MSYFAPPPNPPPAIPPPPPPPPGGPPPPPRAPFPGQKSPSTPRAQTPGGKRSIFGRAGKSSAKSPGSSMKTENDPLLDGKSKGLARFAPCQDIFFCLRERIPFQKKVSTLKKMLIVVILLLVITLVFTIIILLHVVGALSVFESLMPYKCPAV